VVAAGDDLSQLSRARLIIEATMAPYAPVNRLEQSARSIRIRRLVAELAGVAELREISIEQPWRNPIGQNRFHRGEATQI